MKVTSLLFLACSLCYNLSSQVLCIQCYDQNEPLSSGTTNLVQNGGFESECMGYICPNSDVYQCDVDNWTCTGGDVLTYTFVYDELFNVVPEGNKAVYMGNWFCATCSIVPEDVSCISTEACVVSGIPEGFPKSEVGYGEEVGVSLSQTISGLTEGNVYVLEFWTGGEYGFPTNGIFAIDVGFGNIMLECVTTEATSAPVGRRYLIQFVANGSSQEIKFTNWGHSCSQCTEVAIDDVIVYSIDELDESVEDCSTGVSAIANAETPVIFPNPTESAINFSGNLPGSFLFTIFDTSSRQILSERVSAKNTFNLDFLDSGIYFYTIAQDDFLQSGILRVE